MTTFSWLLIGHLIGDWVLQNDWMAKGKKRGLVTLPGMTHFSVYTISIIAILRLGSQASGGVVLTTQMALLIFVSHWLIDATSVVNHWMRFCGQSDIPMVRIMVDQTFHLLILAIIATVWA